MLESEAESFEQILTAERDKANTYLALFNQERDFPVKSKLTPIPPVMTAVGGYESRSAKAARLTRQSFASLRVADDKSSGGSNEREPADDLLLDTEEEGGS